MTEPEELGMPESLDDFEDETPGDDVFFDDLAMIFDGREEEPDSGGADPFDSEGFTLDSEEDDEDDDDDDEGDEEDEEDEEEHNKGSSDKEQNDDAEADKTSDKDEGTKKSGEEETDDRKFESAEETDTKEKPETKEAQSDSDTAEDQPLKQPKTPLNKQKQQQKQQQKQKQQKQKQQQQKQQQQQQQPQQRVVTNAEKVKRRKLGVKVVESSENALPPPKWQNHAADKPHREQTVREIARLIQIRKRNEPTEQWIKQLPIKARFLEEQLYQNAPSLSAYLDKHTLKERLTKQVKRLTVKFGRSDGKHPASSNSDPSSQSRHNQPTSSSSSSMQSSQVGMNKRPRRGSLSSQASIETIQTSNTSNPVLSAASASGGASLLVNGLHRGNSAQHEKAWSTVMSNGMSFNSTNAGDPPSLEDLRRKKAANDAMMARLIEQDRQLRQQLELLNGNNRTQPGLSRSQSMSSSPSPSLGQMTGNPSNLQHVALGPGNNNSSAYTGLNRSQSEGTSQSTAHSAVAHQQQNANNHIAAQSPAMNPDWLASLLPRPINPHHMPSTSSNTNNAATEAALRSLAQTTTPSPSTTNTPSWAQQGGMILGGTANNNHNALTAQHNLSLSLANLTPQQLAMLRGQAALPTAASFLGAMDAGGGAGAAANFSAALAASAGNYPSMPPPPPPQQQQQQHATAQQQQQVPTSQKKGGLTTNNLNGSALSNQTFQWK